MALTQVQSGMMDSIAQYNSFKNRLINGAMVIDQRNNGASYSTSTSAIYTLDRWFAQLSQLSKYTVQQNAGSVTPPAGYSKYLGVTSSSAYSVLTTDYFGISQSIEGLNIADLDWGTASAATVTLSFWVRSSLTGTFGGNLNNSGSTRNYVFSYTINAANTWEQKTVTIVGDTTGTWLTTNGVGIRVWFNLGAGATYSGTAGSWSGTASFAPTGAVSVVGTSGATFYITGVQLEKGSTATAFDYRPYGTELSLCQRYYYKVTAEQLFSIFGTGVAVATNQINGVVPFNTQMRTNPAVSFSTLRIYGTGGGIAVTAVDGTLTSKSVGGLGVTVTGATLNTPYYIQANNSTSAYIDFSAEL